MNSGYWWLWLLCIFLTSALAQEPLKIRDYSLEIVMEKDQGFLIVKQSKKMISKTIIKVDRGPAVKKFQHFVAKGEDYLLLDLNRGYTFGSKQETSCSEVSLWRLAKNGKLSVLQTEEYQCEVNAADDYLKSKEFYHPYRLNQQLPKIEYLKQ